MWLFKSRMQAFLQRGLDEVEPLLEKYGFAYAGGLRAVSSGGPFINVRFERDDFEIGLVVRELELGCPNYSAGSGFAGHPTLLGVLGVADEAQLVEGKHLSFRARAGGDPFDALSNDLGTLILPVLARSADELRAAINRAAALHRRRMGNPG